MARALLKLLLAAVLLVGSASSARAQRLILESYVAAPPASSHTVMPPLRASLNQRGALATTQEVTAQLESSSRVNLPPPASVVEQIETNLSAGFRHWGNVEFDRAIESLREAIALAQQYPLVTTRSADLRRDIFHAHVALALAYQRSARQSEARAELEDIVRTYPEQRMPFDRFGPQPEALRRQVEADLRAEAEGRLVVSSPSGEPIRVFVNEQFIGNGASVEASLLPGRYRVFTTSDAHVSRIREIRIDSGRDHRLTIDPRLDSILRLEPRPMMVFADEVERSKRQRGYVRELVHQASAASGMILLHVESAGDMTRVIGEVLTAEGQRERAGAVRVDAELPQVESLEALAEFLANGVASPAIEVLSGSALSARPSHTSRFGAWKWVGVGIGVAAAATGATLLYLDGRGTCDVPGQMRCPREYGTKTAGVATLSVAGVAAVAATLMWIFDDAPVRERTQIGLGRTTSGSWTVGLSGQF